MNLLPPEWWLTAEAHQEKHLQKCKEKYWFKEKRILFSGVLRTTRHPAWVKRYWEVKPTKAGLGSCWKKLRCF